MINPRFKIFLGILLLASACSTQAIVLPVTVSNATTVNQQTTADSEQTGSSPQTQSSSESLQLTWNKGESAVQSYKIFFNKTEKNSSGGTLVKTITAEAGKEISNSTDLALSALGADVPKTGEFCFYIVAESAGQASEPSDSSCLSL